MPTITIMLGYCPVKYSVTSSIADGIFLCKIRPYSTLAKNELNLLAIIALPLVILSAFPFLSLVF